MMKRTPLMLALLALFLSTMVLSASTAADDLEPTVILISLDGFRWDYLQRPQAASLQRLAAEGVSVPRGIIPAFPTKTFPNHYSIVTGLHPQSHGIVANTMYDPQWDAWFRIADREAVEDGRWWGGEPIWVTAERQGQIAGTFFWVGSEAPIGDRRPTYWRRFDAGVSGEKRIDAALGWLDEPRDQRPTLITLYFENTDNAGHNDGPESAGIAAAIAKVDGYLRRLRSGLEARGIFEKVNLVVTADHGMSALSNERTIVLSDLVELTDVDIVQTTTPVLAIRPPPQRIQQVYEALRGAHPKLDVYLRDETPERWYFRRHRRIAPIIGLVADGWTVVADQAALGRFVSRQLQGNHGFDNRAESMQAVFVARGPAFRSGVEVEPFENIHLYELIAEILELDPAPNDGSLAAVQHLLAE